MIEDQTSAPSSDDLNDAGDEQNEDIVNGVEDAAESELTEAREEAARYREEAARNLAGWQRAQADLVNLKRRSDQDVSDRVQRRQQEILRGLLDLADDFERALADDSGESDAWRTGVIAIQAKLQGLLLKQSVLQIETEGESFDPNLHEAVGQLPGEHNEIVAVLRTGYTVGGRVLRATQVMVGNGQVGPAGDAPVNDDEERI